MLLQESLRRYLGDPPAAHGLSQDETVRGLLTSVWEGAIYNVSVSLIGGQYLAGYALFMGAGPRGIAIVTALPALAGVIQVAAAPYVAAGGHRVRAVAAGAALHRIGWGLAGFLPLLLPKPFWFGAFALLLFLAFAAQVASVPAWWSLMSDLTADRVRGRYFGLRNAVLAAFAVVTVLAAGTVLDRAPGLSGFLILHGAAVLFGIVNVTLVLAYPEPPRRRETAAPPLLPLGNRSFRLIAGFVAAWTLSQTLSTPFYALVMLRQLSLSYSAISWLTVTAAVSTTASLFVWGPLCDRVGEGRLISWLAPVAASVPLGWLLAGQGGVPLLFLLHAAQGAAAAGINLALGNLNLAIAGDGGERTVYLALFSATIGLSGGLGPLLGGWIGFAMPVFLAGGAAGWVLWALWWLWYRPRHLLRAAVERS